MRDIAMSLGRYNPPTKGHFESLRRLKELSEEHKIPAQVYVIDGEQTGQDKSKNPLDPDQRITILKSWFPGIHFDIAGSAFEAMEILQVQNKRPSIWVAGSDRAQRYRMLLEYSGFGNSKVIELNRNEGKAAHVSATAARVAAIQGDFKRFRDMMPDHVDDTLIAETYSLVRKAIQGDGTG